jgi:hypothetical protein
MTYLDGLGIAIAPHDLAVVYDETFNKDRELADTVVTIDSFEDGGSKLYAIVSDKAGKQFKIQTRVLVKLAGIAN